jgi:hypothetical protein
LIAIFSAILLFEHNMKFMNNYPSNKQILYNPNEK